MNETPNPWQDAAKAVEALADAASAILADDTTTHAQDLYEAVCELRETVYEGSRRHA